MSEITDFGLGKTPLLSLKPQTLSLKLTHWTPPHHCQPSSQFPNSLLICARIIVPPIRSGTGSMPVRKYRKRIIGISLPPTKTPELEISPDIEREISACWLAKRNDPSWF